MTDDVEVRFGATVDGAIANIKNLTETVEGFGSNVESLTSPLKGLGEAIAAAFAIEKIDQFIERIGDLGLQVERTSVQLGLTVQQVSLLNYAAETNDVSTSQMRNSLERLTVGLQAAESGTNRQADAFKQLSGETAQEFLKSGGSMADLIERVAKNTADLNGKVNLAPSFIALMGRSGADAIPVFLELGEHIDTLKQRVAEAGLSFNPGFIDAISDTRKANIDLKESNDGLGASIFSILKPAIDVAILGLRGFVQNLQDSTQYGGILWGILEGLTGGFLILETAVIAVADVIKLVFQTLLTGINAAMNEVGGAAQALYDIAHGNFQKAVDDIKAGNANAVKTLKDGGDLISKNTNDTLDKLKKSWSDYWTAITTGSDNTNKALQGGGFASGGKGAPLSGSDANAQAAAKKMMDEDIQNHKAMLEEELADVGQNLRAKMILAQQYYDWLKSKYPQNVVAMAQAGKQIAQIQNEEAKQSERSWEKFFNSFNSGIMGMLKGTQTFKQALGSMLEGVINTWLKAIEKIAAQWISSEITKTSATNVGNAARTASNTGAAAAGKAAEMANAKGSITTSASKAAAAVYADVAEIPVVGWLLAPAAAAAAFVGVEAFGSMVPSYAVGTPYVPQTGLAMIHQGEAIIPADLNKNGLGGGNAVHFHVSAIDSRSVSQFFEAHGGTIAKQVVDQFKRGNPAFRYPRQ